MTGKAGWKSIAVLAALLAASRAAAQETAQPRQTPAPYRLTRRDAVQRGLQSNLRARVGGTRIEEAEATRERRLAALFPRVRGESFANLQNRNLRAFGISLPGAPAVVGPFSNYDVRLYAEQPILDLQSYRNWKASQKQEQAVREDVQDIRDTIVRQVTALYLNAQAAAARARAAESRVTTAEELLRLAQARHDAGVATGVDVLRAQVRLANEQQRRLEARNATEQALLSLARNIGMSPGTPLELADALAFQVVERIEVPQVLAASLVNRSDYVSLQTQRQALVEQQRASRARYLPKFTVGGNYGGLGRSLGDMKGTGLLQGTISVTLFDRDRESEQKQLESQIQRVEYQMADLRLGIEEEIRQAVLQLESAAEEVKVAGQGQQLSERELALARDRFQEGVANNLEVISAQDSLSRAQENYILALVRHNDARMALARALGATEKTYEQYLGNK